MYVRTYVTSLSLLSPFSVQALESGLSWSQEFAAIFDVLSNLLGDQQSLSAYEVYSSNIIPSMLQCLTGVRRLVYSWVCVWVWLVPHWCEEIGAPVGCVCVCVVSASLV